MGPYAGFNLSDSVGDKPMAVVENREILRQVLDLPAEPPWLRQVHGRRVVELRKDSPGGAEADAVVCAVSGQVCAVMTADCLPVLFCDYGGTRIGAAHAGWRGLAAGVLGATVEALEASPGDLMAWLGPAIGPKRFEVGEEVREAFLQRQHAHAGAFVPSRPGHWYADIYRLAHNELSSLGVAAIFGGGLCTYTDTQRFFSYRRGHPTGRMASLIWMEDETKPHL